MTDRQPKPGKQRYRRTDEELIQDLQKRIQELKNRKAVREIKKDPASKDATTAFRALTKAVDKSKDSGDADLKRALSEAQRVLAGYFESKGLKVPKARKPRARKSS